MRVLNVSENCLRFASGSFSFRGLSSLQSRMRTRPFTTGVGNKEKRHSRGVNCELGRRPGSVGTAVQGRGAATGDAAPAGPAAGGGEARGSRAVAPAPAPNPPTACGPTYTHRSAREGRGEQGPGAGAGAGSRQEGLPHARWGARSRRLRSWATGPGRGHSWAPARGTRPTPTTSVVPTRAGRPRGGTGPRGHASAS